MVDIRAKECAKTIIGGLSFEKYEKTFQTISYSEITINI